MLVARRLLPPLLASLTAVTIHVRCGILIVVNLPVLFLRVGMRGASHRMTTYDVMDGIPQGKSVLSVRLAYEGHAQRQAKHVLINKGGNLSIL